MWYSARLDAPSTQLQAIPIAEAEAALHVALLEPAATIAAAPLGAGTGLDDGASGSRPQDDTRQPTRELLAPKTAPAPVRVKPVANQPASEPALAEEPDEAEEEPDLFALDSLLTADNAADSIATPPRPRAMRTQALRSKGAAHASRGKARGTGTGSVGNGPGAGRSGSGSGAGGFGGAQGHFRGQVCFIEPGTKALRELGTCEVQGEFFTDVFNISPRSFTSGFPGVSERSEWFAILYTGVLITLEPGSYRFRVLSDDGAILRIDGEVVVDNDGQHGPVSKSALKFLSRGSHTLELRYFQGPRTMVALQVFVTPPDRPEQLLRGTL